MVAFLVRGEGAALHVFAVMFDGSAKERGRIAVAANKLGRRRKGQVDHVVKHEDLAIAIRTGSDPDGWNWKFCCDLSGHLARNSLEHENAGPGVGEGVCIGL